MPQGLVRQRQRLPLQAVAKSLQRNGFESQTNQGLPAPNQRQGGAVHQNPAGGMGVCDAVRQLRRAQKVAPSLSVDL